MTMALDYQTPPEGSHLRTQKLMAALLVLLSMFTVGVGSFVIATTQTAFPGVYPFVGGWVCAIFGIAWYIACRKDEE